MAKRRRLDPNPGFPDPPEQLAPLDAWAMTARHALGVAAPRAAPIAAVAGESAAQAALETVTAELARARAEGRMLLRLPLAAVDEGYLVRDRMAIDPEEMAALTASIRARGQQVAIEVADLGGGRYGLISGWRRLVVLRQLAAEGGPDTVLAIQRRPEAAAGAYLAMVEENEIRAGLSFYERARVVVRATDQGVFPDDRSALAHLFAAAPRSRRSKIGSFIRLVRSFERPESPWPGLFFPTHLSEKQGLALVAAVDRDPTLADRLAADLAADPPAAPALEAVRIAAALRPPSEPAASPVAPPATSAPEGRLDLDFPDETEARIRGDLVADPAFRQALERWLRGRGWL